MAYATTPKYKAIKVCPKMGYKEDLSVEDSKVSGI
jgi:hypothetical protein